MSWLFTMWQDDLLGRQAFWTSKNFWLALAALVLPFGWVFLLLRLEPVRIRIQAGLRRATTR